MTKRLTWDRYALNIAEAASARSEDPYQKVGACALNKERMVVGVGYNGLASGKSADSEVWSDRDHRRKYMIHAEANCLSLFKKNEADLIAVTLLPCSYCATMIAAYGIKKVIYKDIYKNDQSAFEIFSFYRINLVRLD